MAPRVKICGMRSLADMQIAVQQGADAIGVLVGQLHSSSDFLPANVAAEIAKINVEGPSAIERARELDQQVDAIVLDSINRTKDQVGGTGITHDWGISGQIVKHVSTPVILAGSLTPANVRDAIRRVQPWAVDVNSGVRNLIRAFMEASKMRECNLAR